MHTALDVTGALSTGLRTGHLGVSTNSANRMQDLSKALNCRPVSSHIDEIKHLFIEDLQCAWFYSRH